MTPILIGDRVVAQTGSGHPYEGVEGVVIASRRDPGTGKIEHQIEFPRRQFSVEEIDRGEDKDPYENIVWLMADEVSKAVG